jgi:flagellar biosynthesis/type III secretory pathway chaperone
MAELGQALNRLEELLQALQHLAWQQRQALVALRVGAVEALAAQQTALLQEVRRWQEHYAPLLDDVRRDAELQHRWERLRIYAAEVRRLLQLNRLLAQRAQQHTAELLEALFPDGHVYDRQG